MAETLQINKSTVSLLKGDIIDLDVDAFVFYARSDLQLGSGFGTAISVRGGPSIQEELKALGTRGITEAVISSAGELRASYIVHAVGPKFQEEDTAGKLRATINNALKAADDKGVSRIAFPAMGAGFYGVPLPQSAEITIDTIITYLSGETKIEEVIIVLLDNREYKPFAEHLQFRKQSNRAEATV